MDIIEKNYDGNDVLNICIRVIVKEMNTLFIFGEVNRDISCNNIYFITLGDYEIRRLGD